MNENLIKCAAMIQRTKIQIVDPELSSCRHTTPGSEFDNLFINSTERATCNLAFHTKLPLKALAPLSAASWMAARQIV